MGCGLTYTRAIYKWLFRSHFFIIMFTSPWGIIVC